MTPDQSRIEASRAQPRIVLLWQALTALRTPITFMQSGAHPDDETSDMLAALRFGAGIGLAYVCSTRGEGGQNDIGTETGAALGVLRTAEMERAAERLDMRLRWLTPAPGDPLSDFGFSKSGEETLERWGRERTLSRFASALRAERPDILCPTFLDVPGQHGHHRAMTLLAPEAIERAADPAWQDGRAPWRTAKLYLPAWSGAGTSYDDEEPPPPATVTVRASGRDPVTGWSHALMGQQSRAMHRTQGMGRWPGEGRDLPLHLVGGGAEASVADGLPGLADLGAGDAQSAMEDAIAAFPGTAAVRRHAARALALLPAGGGEHAHRFERKRRELARVLWLASGCEARAACDEDWIEEGVPAPLRIEARAGAATSLSVAMDLPEGWRREGETLVAGGAPPDPYPSSYDPLSPPLPALRARARIEGLEIEMRLPMDRAPAALPARRASLSPEREIHNLADPVSRIPLRLSPPEAGLDAPGGIVLDDGALVVSDGVAPGRYDMPVTLAGAPALSARRLSAPHLPPRTLCAPAILSLAVIDAVPPEAATGYLGAGNDRVGHWLGRMGLDVTALEASDLRDAQLMAGLDTLVIGVFAIGALGLGPAMPGIHDWVRAGGNLVTLYHRPWDGWDPATVPPAPLTIGQPSLRWRVTDAGAEVTHLAPDHPLLTGPNEIGPADWQGWDKERGLYFASGWDAAYEPLLSMADPGEAPLDGALLSARIGEGRHTHCALILHHQMEALVPGAFRLMANLCQEVRANP